MTWWQSKAFRALSRDVQEIKKTMSDTQLKVDADAARIAKLDTILTTIVVPGLSTLRQEVVDLRGSVDTSKLEAAITQMETDIAAVATGFTPTTATDTTTASA